VTAAELIALLPAVACMVFTLAAFMAFGAWRELRNACDIDHRQRAKRRIATLALLGLIAFAAPILLWPQGPPLQDSLAPHASYDAKSALFQLALSASIVAPFVAWVIWRRLGASALGLGTQDAIPSLAIGVGVSLACVAMLGKLSMSFWSSPSTWWLLLAMLGVGATEELIFRGFVLHALAKRLSRLAAEAWSAAIFSVVHTPQRLVLGMSITELAVSLAILFIWGWCYAAAMRKGKHVPGLALVHAIANVCLVS
jgi:membrane protease YdiL (CAAX protease family)